MKAATAGLILMVCVPVMLVMMCWAMRNVVDMVGWAL